GDLKDSYCSLHPARLGGAEQVLIATGAGLTAFDPANGTVLWQYDAPLDQGMTRIVQPTLVGDSDVLLGAGFGAGTQRVRVSRESSGLVPSLVWESKAFSPYFNDQVVHGGHLYGFHGNFFTCVNLDDGKGRWKARGYGN